MMEKRVRKETCHFGEWNVGREWVKVSKLNLPLWFPAEKVLRIRLWQVNGKPISPHSLKHPFHQKEPSSLLEMMGERLLEGKSAKSIYIHRA